MAHSPKDIKRILSNRAKSQARRKKSHKRRLRRWQRDLIEMPRVSKAGKVEREKTHYTSIKVPAEFSFIQKTDDALQLVERLKQLYKHSKPVNINLKGLKTLTNDAIILLLCVMNEFIKRKIRVVGTYPDDPEVRRKLEQSGFFSHVFGHVEEKNLHTRNTIFAENSKIVSSDLSGRIIDNASMTVHGDNRPNEGLQRLLIECMTNTFDHANSKSEGAENWWLSVEHHEAEKKVSFAFIDNGIGILRSIQRTSDFKGLAVVVRSLVSGGNTRLLERMLKGDLKKGYKSVTGKPHRGKGIPGIYDAFERNSFSHLEIITNDVHAKLATSEFKKLDIEFQGTFVYAEYDTTNEE